jgi:hypothetical protein
MTKVSVGPLRYRWLGCMPCVVQLCDVSTVSRCLLKKNLRVSTSPFCETCLDDLDLFSACPVRSSDGCGSRRRVSRSVCCCCILKDDHLTIDCSAYRDCRVLRRSAWATMFKMTLATKCIPNTARFFVL